MAPASNEEQFKFLISCIRYSNNGKVDFGQVAQECKIVSKGAAAKRYERMMRAHGIAPNATSIRTQSSSRTKNEQHEPSIAGAPKKRKLMQFPEDHHTFGDDEEGFATNIKPDPVGLEKQTCIKEEDSQLSLGDAANLLQYYDNQPFPCPHLEVEREKDYCGSSYDGDSLYLRPSLGGPYGMHAPFDFSASRITLLAPRMHPSAQSSLSERVCVLVVPLTVIS